MAEFIKVMQKREKICECYGNYRNCANCPLSQNNNSYTMLCDSFISSYPQEAEKIIMEWEKPVDWSNVEVDTPILVKCHNEDEWKKKHFAKYEDNKVFAWHNGMTSWSVDDDTYRVTSWEYAKLAE